MELRIYFLQKLTSTGNQTFLRKFYTTKIWSYTVYGPLELVMASVFMYSIYITLYITSALFLLANCYNAVLYNYIPTTSYPIIHSVTVIPYYDNLSRAVSILLLPLSLLHIDHPTHLYNSHTQSKQLIYIAY